MSKSRPGDWIEKLDLQEVIDPKTGKSSFRRISVLSSKIRDGLEAEIEKHVRSFRESCRLSEHQVAYLAGIESAEYSAYEHAPFSCSLGYLLIFCEITGASIEELLKPISLYLEAGITRDTELRCSVMRELMRLDADTLADVQALLRHLV